MRYSPLPPMNTLVAFEAAARNKNFSQAASELALTPGAISKQMKQLEEFLGRRLFIRDKKSLRLSTYGEKYFEEIQECLSGLTRATAELIGEHSHNEITVACTNTTASMWLIPKLPDFQQIHPEAQIRIVTMDSFRELQNIDFDIGLFYCRDVPENINLTHILEEDIFPVCSPGFLEVTGPINHPGDILKHTLIDLESDQGYTGWREWFSSQELSYQEPQHLLMFNSYALSIQAALNGQGIALAWENTVFDALETGKLLIPFDHSISSGDGFSILEPLQPSKSLALAFKNWMLNMEKNTSSQF